MPPTAAPTVVPPGRGVKPRSHRSARKRRRLGWRILTAFGLAGLLVAVADLVWPRPLETEPPFTAINVPEATPTPSSAPSPAPPTEAPPVLSLSGDFPATGPGTFTFADAEGDVLGESGTLLRFRVAVEDGLDEDADEVAGFIDETLGDERSWIAGGQVRFQRVPSGAADDFTIYLATGETAAAMCAAVSVNIRAADGVPYTSCRGPGQVILNLNRWRLSVPEYLAAEVPLERYRQYVVNHEVGHELGYGHERCPGQGEPAPVMQQQTLFLNGCEAYAWPYRDGERYAGAPA